MIDWARYVHKEYLTGTAITIIVVLLILLVSPRSGGRRLRSALQRVRPQRAWTWQLLRRMRQQTLLTPDPQTCHKNVHSLLHVMRKMRNMQI